MIIIKSFFLINNKLFKILFLKYDKYKYSIFWMLIWYILKYWSKVKKNVNKVMIKMLMYLKLCFYKSMIYFIFYYFEER